jgi:CII-binding regulator of phage lambda lysogenization HflD
MGYSSRAIDKESFNAVAETCPKVDAALEKASEAIKEQTGLLRDALREYIERALNAEDELSTANETIAELAQRVADLEHELAHVDA